MAGEVAWDDAADVADVSLPKAEDQSVDVAHLDSSNQVAPLPQVLKRHETLDATIVTSPNAFERRQFDVSQKSSADVVHIGKPMSVVKRPVISRISINPSTRVEGPAVHMVDQPLRKVARPAFQRVNMPSTTIPAEVVGTASTTVATHAVRRASASRIATREVVWAAWRSLPSLRMFRMVMRLLGAIAMVFFCAYYSYLVLVFGATFSEARMQIWLVEACVTIFLSETVITGFSLTLRLFVSYVVSRMLWTLNGNKKQDICMPMGGSRSGGSDQQGPSSLQFRRSSPTVTSKSPIIFPENRYQRRESRGGAAMHLESMSSTVTKKTPIVLSHNRYLRTSRSGTIMHMQSMSPTVTKKTPTLLPQTRRGDQIQSVGIMGVVDI